MIVGDFWLIVDQL